MGNVLIINSNLSSCTKISDIITNMQHNAVDVQTLDKGVQKAMTGEFDLVFLAATLSDGNGLACTSRILSIPSPPEVIIMGDPDSDTAEQAIKNGAWEYLQKPISTKSVIQAVNRVFSYREGIQASPAPRVSLKREGIIGSSRRMRQCLATVTKAANSNANVLITGDTGTGKELFARAIHANSSRAGNPFVVVDCAALPATLVESVLFGHEKGSFTGADKTVRGLISQAHGGTLFLDEVGEMDLNLQKAFLRVLQEHRFRPVGCRKEAYSDFRVIAATNRDPDRMVEQKLFRKDLLYRLNAISLGLPTLKARSGDLEELVTSLMETACRRLGTEPKGISQDFIRTLALYDWPGNVRELINTLEGAISEAYYEPVLFTKHLPEHFRILMARSAMERPETGDAAHEVNVTREVREPHGIGRPEETEELPPFRAFRESALARAEKRYLNTLMKTTRGNIKQACSVSSLGRTRLYTLLKKHGVDRMGWSNQNVT
ncbi:MAG: sigma-54-dependent Fis family transcriptional regulator [Desulfobacteraceae bacterium]|nr:sigma-54-dependent Fis family transcriptional regulator [Desulfobacteraceae bacterium]